jgi:hypothetical protein
VTPKRPRTRDSVVDEPSDPRPVTREPIGALRGVFETRMSGDDGGTTKASRVDRHQAERETTTQGVTDDLVDTVGQGTQDVFDAVLEGPNGRRVGPMSGEVDRERTSFQAGNRSTNPRRCR